MDIYQESGLVRIQLQPRLTVANLDNLEEEFQSEVAEAADKVILDFSQVEELDCAGARQIVYFLDTLQQGKKEVEITNLDSPYVREFFDISGLREELEGRERINICDELQPF